MPAPTPATTVPPPASTSIEILSDCPFSDLRRLTCEEALVRTDAVQVVVDQARAIVGMTELVTVDIMPEPMLGLHVLPLRDGAERVLMVTEDFLLRGTRVEEVQHMVCFMSLRSRHSRLPVEARMQQCEYRLAALTGEMQRARWLWRTTPPEFRLRPFRGTAPRRYEPCSNRRPCPIAVDRLA
jgi:hypothetical protein